MAHCNQQMHDPNLALIAFALGLGGVLLELTAPGLILPGVIGGWLAASALGALSAFSWSGIGVALLLLALLLWILEWKFFTHGVLSAAGAVAMTAGSAMFGMRIHPGLAVAAMLPLASISALMMTLAVRARRNKVVTGALQQIQEEVKR